MDRTRLWCGIAIYAGLTLLGIGGTAHSAQNTGFEPVTSAEMAEIRQAFAAIGLTQADLSRGGDGRVALIGEYQDRDEVETAFAAARAVVGLRRVAPTTPANIKYRLKGFENAFAATVGRMMQRPQQPTVASVTPNRTEQGQVAARVAQRPAEPPTTAASAVSGTVSRPHETQGSAAPANPPHQTARPQRTFALVIGVGRFKNLPSQNYLEFAGKDAADFAATLTSPAGGGVSKEYIHLVRDEQATAHDVHAALQKLLVDTQAGDTVVVFVASHGLPNAMGKFDIVLNDTQFTRKQVGNNGSLELSVTDRSTTLSDEDLGQIIGELVLKDVRSVVVLDTCYSGKTFASVPGFLPSRTRSLTQYNKEVAYVTSPSSEAVADLAQKAKDASTTRIVIVSASENEESLEAPDFGGGMFTQLYIASLKKAHDYADAFDQTKPTVIKRARTYGLSQTPRLLVVPEEAVTAM